MLNKLTNNLPRKRFPNHITDSSGIWIDKALATHLAPDIAAGKGYKVTRLQVT